MKCEETTVEFLTFRFKYTYLDLNACILKFLDASSLYLGILIDTAHDDTSDSFLNDQIGTRGRLAIMGTRFQGDIHRSPRQQAFVLCPYGCKGIHLGMSLATTHMIPLTDDSAVGTHNHCPHHRVRLRILLSVLGQLDAPSHEFFVVYHILMSLYCLMFVVYR